MDAKSIKSHLKEAKEAIKNKDIEKALKLCKVSGNENSKLEENSQVFQAQNN